MGDVGTLSRRRDSDNFRPGLKAIEVIRPNLHHPPAFGQIFGVDVGGRHLISFGVCHLAFYNVPAEAEFTQSRGGQSAKPVPRHSDL